MSTYTDMIAAVRPAPLTIPLGDGFTAACWNGPTSFDAQSQRALYAAIVEMASIVFHDDMSPYWQKRAEEGYLDGLARLFLIYDPEGELVGWTGYHRLHVGDEVCLYADATGVHPRVQRYGLMARIMSGCFLEELARNRLRPVYWTLRTESPIVYTAFRRCFGEESVYPKRDAETPPRVRELALATAAWLGQEEKLRPATLRIEGAFGGPCPWRYTADGEPLGGAHLSSPDERDNAFFRSALRPEDTFLVVAESSLGNLTKLIYRAARAQVGPLLRKLTAPLQGVGGSPK